MIGYLDCSSGVSGDKFLGALLDACQPSIAEGLPAGEGTVEGAFTVETLRNAVRAVAPEAEVRTVRVHSHGIAAIAVRVEAVDESPSRAWSHVRALLETSALPDRVRASSLSVFETLAAAEARVHGVAVADVHFHEVGALDSILDVVGVCAGMHALGVEALAASPVAVGGGTVETSHGLLPVPAPATAVLLGGVSVTGGPTAGHGGPIGELTTPTGAALLVGLGATFGVCPPMVPTAVGFGAGTRDIGIPNICTLILGEPAPPPPSLTSEDVALLETNLDHLSPEELAFAAEQLLAEGALDVWQTPIVMKKGRSATLLSVLASAADAARTAGRIVSLTGSLGVRRTDLPRYAAERSSVVVGSPWGDVRVKVGPEGGQPRYRPEYDDVARIAAENSLPFGFVRDTILGGLASGTVPNAREAGDRVEVRHAGDESSDEGPL